MNLSLQGGTADLYKYNEGAFVVPEPSGIAGIAMLAVVLSRRRRHL